MILDLVLKLSSKNQQKSAILIANNLFSSDAKMIMKRLSKQKVEDVMGRAPIDRGSS